MVAYEMITQLIRFIYFYLFSHFLFFSMQSPKDICLRSVLVHCREEDAKEFILAAPRFSCSLLFNTEKNN